MTCLVIKTDRNMTTIIVTLGEDLVLLSLVLIGLRCYGNVGMYGLWRFLHCQVYWNSLWRFEVACSRQYRRDPHSDAYPLILSHGSTLLK